MLLLPDVRPEDVGGTCGLFNLLFRLLCHFFSRFVCVCDALKEDSAVPA